MKIVIVEDEFPILQLIKKHLKDILVGQITQIHEFSSLDAAQQYLKINLVDLLLLDLNLNGKNGFDLLTHLVAESFHTIVISAYQERAIEAFEYGVLDFVPKPFNRDRLQKAFDRLQLAQANHLKFLAIKHSGRIRLVPIEEVMYVQGAGNYSEVFLKNGEKVLHDKALDKLHHLLPPSFERIHKSYLAQMNEAKDICIYQGSKYELVLTDGTSLPIGRTRYKYLKEKWV
ncbi:LytR/AlgR family response regulator transcription factor [Microscilla marina]|uniref:LytTr DNA-binding domain family n=1 Tax=Microscilla marina ATCC 23134 TaxID=313606 RepID=A1ZRN0_MICM2|nr:LytTR family DNA-binding domain-containing protein [Microscilla marina]EAY26935.1 LytTr DNA-binding domain family [Microscilla marina ATCC 23134]